MAETSETLVTVAAVCRMFPGRTGRGISRATLWRWMLRGIGGVRLESVKIGGVRYVTRKAVERFVAALNRGTHVNNTADPHCKTKQVERQLDAEGL
ncbi:MAG: DUF1580 domain-containing protein [Thermoguttaceae bacterium]